MKGADWFAETIPLQGQSAHSNETNCLAFHSLWLAVHSFSLQARVRSEKEDLMGTEKREKREKREKGEREEKRTKNIEKRKKKKENRANRKDNK